MTRLLGKASCIFSLISTLGSLRVPGVVMIARIGDRQSGALVCSRRAPALPGRQSHPESEAEKVCNILSEWRVAWSGDFTI